MVTPQNPLSPAMRRRTRRAGGTGRLGFALVVVAGLMLPSAASAQSTTPTTVSDLLNSLFFSPVPYNPLANPLLTEAEYNRRGRDSLEGVAIGIGNALSSFPLGASSAGFSYVVDPTTGERVLKTTSFGTVFVDRALSNGRGVFNVGFSYQRGSYDTLQGLNLEDDGFVVISALGTYPGQSTPGVGDVELGYLETSANVFTFAGSYGVTDSFDVGWALPIASLKVRGRNVRSYNGGIEWEQDRVLGNGVRVRDAYPNKVGEITQFDRTVEASGIGDVVVRAKYALGPATSQGVAVSLDLHLPTGDEENLLGAGKVAAKLQLSGTRALGGIFSVHGNGGYTFGGRADEANFSGAIDASLLSRKQLTVSFEFLGQMIRDTVSADNYLTTYDAVGGFSDLPRRVVVQYGFWDRGQATLLRGAAGLKYQLGGSTLLTASALFRLNDEGYQAKITPFIGIEHSFGGR